MTQPSAGRNRARCLRFRLNSQRNRVDLCPMEQLVPTHRRDFLQTVGAGSLALASAASAKEIAGAGERIACAVIGVRGRGRTFYGPLSSRKDTSITALCDVDA